MSSVFLSVFNRSIAAGWIVLAIVLLRQVFRKMPKWVCVLLWAMVAIRLLLPVSIKSTVSLVPSAQTIAPQTMVELPKITTGFSYLNSAINPVIQESTVVISPEKSVNTLKLAILVFSRVWAVGVVAMVGYMLLSSIRLRRRIGTAVRLRENIYQSERVDSPFVFGLFRPRIYLPFQVEAQDLAHILAHERAHIHRRDHWWKPLGFCLLSLTWFNPLMWLGYWLLCRDIEQACDEKVIGDLAPNQRADYAQALLSCSVHRKAISACPLAFGEGNVKRRIRSVLHYKKPAFWILVVAIIAGIVVAVCFLTDPVKESEASSQTEATEPEESLPPIEVYGSSTGGATFDIDGDGVEETCSIEYNNSLSLFCYFAISVTRDDQLLYYNAFASHSDNISIKNTNLGFLFCLDEYFYKPSIVNGVIVLTPYEEDAPAIDYSGYQGVNQNMWVIVDADGTVLGMGSYPDGETVEPPALSEPVYIVDLTRLKRKFPMYFNLPTDKGLEVYVWQMAEGQYSCGLLPGRNLAYEDSELWDLHKNAATLEEMRAIVDSYGLTRDRIHVIPIHMPYSSYWYEIDDSYRDQLREHFWSIPADMGIHVYSPIIDSASFDIDGDGIVEVCSLTHGPTSGLFTFVLRVTENGEEEFYHIFEGAAGPLSFEAGQQGEMVLKLIPYNTPEKPAWTYRFVLKDGYIALEPMDSQAPQWNYWGTQRGKK